MKRTWTTVGREVVPDDKREEVGRYLDAMEWVDPTGRSFGLSPGMAIKEAIKELQIPRVTHVATDNAMAPFDLLGIRAHYKNGRADIYMVDRGTDCVIIATDFYPVEV